MDQGRIVHTGRVSELIDDAALRQRLLGLAL